MRFKGNKGFTLIELLIVVAIIGIIAAIAIPGLMRARMSGNESSAIGSLRSINSAESTFSSSCAAGGYAVSLADLILAPAGQTGFISPDLDPAVSPAPTLAGGTQKSGYEVEVQADTTAVDITPATGTCNGAATAFSAYWAQAVPVQAGSTGVRSFGTDTRGTVFQDINSAVWANPLPNPLGAGQSPVQ